MNFISAKEDFCSKEMFSTEIIRKGFISDVLNIPMEDIKSVRLMNPFLWKRIRKQKQGILDVYAELNDCTKINIEIQIRFYSHWEQRSLFYLSKMYTEDLKVGGNYSKLKRCISISILDYNLTDKPIYHSIYRLRDEYGNEFSDLLELHIIELRKQLNGEDYNLDNWIRFFNAESREDLDMIQTKNTGLQEAIRQLKEMNLPKQLRLLHEAKLKAKRDRWAQDEYVRQQGFIKGQELEREKNMQLLIPALLQSNTPPEEIILRLEQHYSISHEEALEYYEKYKNGVC